MSSGALAMASFMRRSSSGVTSASPRRERRSCSREFPKNTLEHMADLGAAGLLLGDAGAVEKGPALLAMPDVALLFEDANGGEDGGVGERRSTGELADEVGDGGLSAGPEEPHESELGFGQRDGALGGHRCWNVLCAV